MFNPIPKISSLKTWRKEQGLTQRDVALTLQKSQDFIKKMDNTSDTLKLKRLAIILHITAPVLKKHTDHLTFKDVCNSLDKLRRTEQAKLAPELGLSLN